MLLPSRLAMALTAIPLTVGLGACSSSGGNTANGVTPSTPNSPSATASGTSCGNKLAPASTAAALPSGFPSPAGAVFYRLTPVGSTKVHFAYIAGSNVVQTRDAIKAQLIAAGFTIKG